MCHPNAANTHAETYPKFQTQIGKVVLLRDMINWCLEQAARAPQIDADDPRMRALEAYIISQRAGTPLAYGKH
jgi:cytochrome c